MSVRTEPHERDAALRAIFIAGAVPLRIERTERPWAAAVVIAATLVLMATLAFVGPLRSGFERQMVDLAAAVERRGASDLRVTGLLAALVAMPSDRRIDADGPFAVVDLRFEHGGRTGEAPIAWCIELEVPGVVVGLEGGDGPFSTLPAYDPAALAAGRLRIAGVADADRPLAAETSQRIARVMIQRSSFDESTAPVVVRFMAVGTGGSVLAPPSSVRVDVHTPLE
jgi:hypothetical protein